MHLNKSVVLLSAISMAVVSAIDPITLTVGTTAFVASGASVAVGAAGLAALAIAKEALLFAVIKTHQARGGRGGRGRRSVVEAEAAEVASLERQLAFDMNPLFKAIVDSDKDHCAKLMVCSAFAAPEAARTPLQGKVVALMDGQLEQIHADPELGVFQVAAIAGRASGNPALCSTMYSSCPNTLEQLANFDPAAKAPVAGSS